MPIQAVETSRTIRLTAGHIPAGKYSLNIDHNVDYEPDTLVVLISYRYGRAFVYDGNADLRLTGTQTADGLFVEYVDYTGDYVSLLLRVNAADQIDGALFDATCGYFATLTATRLPDDELGN